MSLLRLGSIYTVADNKLAITEASANTFLSKELGWQLQKGQESAIAEAIKEPVAWLGKRQTAIDAVIKDKVAKVYHETAVDKDLAVLPDELREKIAMRRAQSAFAEHLEIQDLLQPGYSKALGRIENNREALEYRGDATNGGLVSKDEKRAYKEKTIAKYKARKAAKKA